MSGYCLGPLSLVKVLRYDWTAKSLTWNIVVSPSGGGKSQAFAKVQKAVLAFEERVIAEVKEKVLKYLEEGEIPEGSEEYDEAWKKAGFVRVSVEGAVSDCLSQKLRSSNFVDLTFRNLMQQHFCKVRVQSVPKLALLCISERSIAASSRLTILC